MMGLGGAGKSVEGTRTPLMPAQGLFVLRTARANPMVLRDIIQEHNMNTPKTQIPADRKALYYGGMALTGVGFLLFISVFFTGAANFGNFENFEGRARSKMPCPK
jgi:hypothetical protein